MNDIARRRRDGSTQGGFTLIEVLVAILVFATGLLALAGLQLQTLRYGHSAGLRTVATMQAASLADMIRANKAFDYRELATAGSDAETPDTEVPDTGAAAADVPETEGGDTVAACFSEDGCTPGQMARLHLALWRESNKVLPSGDGAILLDDDGRYWIDIWWNERTDDSKPTHFITSLQP
ncbi:hypothetical protein GCM10007205_23530 [Oxalicibacterium flavum]|uniref:Type IV pilus modification protein PilV n=1 Tax=Oxalicibacterium flavum TaxID=179467 RepID=A0A8J2UNE3_9BURK|nr:type IV pilus modification protein PilV [Oxalicibacterium flavum]GGC13933.1 hypothetical protein GCM10007205_23530 [Oxalicibacterium flavum]